MRTLEGLACIDTARMGVDNMAIDQAMLEQTSNDSIARLRVYQWAEPTVSLGYFQKLADFESYATTQGLRAVRRATGGGAIVHHHDWTYAVSLPANVANVVAHGASSRLYDVLHQTVVRWLATNGVAAQQWTKTSDSTTCTPQQSCSFLCFERRHEGDVECSGYKIMGSAQRRLGTAILQHGSLLLARSAYAPSLPGLQELAGDIGGWCKTRFYQQLQSALEQPPFSVQWREVSALSPQNVISCARKKFECRQWIARI
jgi:lipoyl(octanoyl) transferase